MKLIRLLLICCCIPMTLMSSMREEEMLPVIVEDLADDMSAEDIDSVLPHMSKKIVPHTDTDARGLWEKALKAAVVQLKEAENNELQSILNDSETRNEVLEKKLKELTEREYRRELEERLKKLESKHVPVTDKLEDTGSADSIEVCAAYGIKIKVDKKELSKALLFLALGWLTGNFGTSSLFAG